MEKLTKTKQKKNNKTILGFDIETHDNNTKLTCASLLDDVDKGMYSYITFDEKSMIDIMVYSDYTDCLVSATNVQFDFFGLFWKDYRLGNFRTLFQGSSLLFAEAFKEHGTFVPTRKLLKSKRAKKFCFIDTMNYACVGVKKAGNILNLPKLDSPPWLGKKCPETRLEWEVLIDYNIRDSEISMKFIKYLYKMFEELGATPKITIASTAMSLFTNKYIKDTYYRMDTEVLKEMFKGYYGGMTETFKRGKIKNYNYYDFNSLYPSVMLNEYPDPNSIRTNTKGDIEYIRNYEGMSHVRIYCPKEIKYPLLPYRYEGKCVFGTGTFTGWYTHVELRKAAELGYVITNIYKTHYFTRTCKPFEEYVKTLYTIRKKIKQQIRETGKYNAIEFVVKILMNSLYGKFGQKFIDKNNLIHESAISVEELSKYSDYKRVGAYFRVVENESKPATFCIPIWASYVTAYGRIKLNELCNKCDPVYCDTDSVLTQHELPESDEIGQLKKEYFIKEGIIVRPKFYAIDYIDEYGKEGQFAKIKGVAKRLSWLEFKGLVSIEEDKDRYVEYLKFAKVKEALIRNFVPNLAFEVRKHLGLEDSKRTWENKFKYYELQEGIPHNFVDGEESVKVTIKVGDN